MRSLLLLILLTTVTASGQSVKDYIRQASQLALEYHWDSAVELLRAGLERHPGNGELLRQMGILLVRSGRLEQGEGFLRQALEREPEDAEALRMAGESALRQGDFPAAVKLLDESLQQAPGNAESHHRIAFALLAQSREEEARHHAAAAVEINPLEARYRRLHGMLLEAAGERGPAEEQFKIAYRLAPRDPGLLMYLGEKRMLDGHLFQALEYLELAVEADPENPVYHLKLSEVHGMLDNGEEARRESRRAQALGHAFEEYLSAIRLSQLGERSQAIQVLESLLEKEEAFPTGMMLLADLYQKSGRGAEALTWYRRVLEQDPLRSAAGEAAAWIQTQRGFLDSALQLLEDSGIETPNRVLIRAYQSMEAGAWDTALEDLRSIEEQNPLHPGLLQLIGYCLQKQGERERALSTLARAESLAPGDAGIRTQARQIRFQKAYDLLTENRWRAALEAFSELLKEDLQPDYLLRMGYCFQQLGDLDQAVTRYQAGLEGDPSATWARINLATSLYLQGRFEQAARQWERVLAAEKTAEAHYQLGLSYSHLQRFPEAERMFSKALEMGDGRPEVYYYLGVSRLYSGQAEGGWKLIRRAASSGFPPAQDMLRRRARRD